MVVDLLNEDSWKTWEKSVNSRLCFCCIFSIYREFHWILFTTSLCSVYEFFNEVDEISWEDKTEIVCSLVQSLLFKYRISVVVFFIVCTSILGRGLSPSCNMLSACSRKGSLQKSENGCFFPALYLCQSSYLLKVNFVLYNKGSVK